MSLIAELARYTYSMLRPPKTQTVSEWADENRVLVSESSAEPGRWRTDRAPYQREIMDAFTQPGIWKIVIMASAQVGKSEIELNMMGCAVCNDPGPMLLVQPTDKTAEDFSKRRIAPMFAACHALRDKIYKAKSRDANNTITMKTFPGGSLAIIGANSPSDLASKPVRYIFFDETDRFPASAGTEGDPIELAERRTETFRHNRKIVETSTPTDKGASKIERSYLRGTQEEWHVECPHCRQYSYIQFSDIVFDKTEFKNEDGQTDYRVTRVAWRCPLCKCETGEFETKRLPAKWVAKNPGAVHNGIRSFRLNAFMSPWSDWKANVLKFLQAKDDPHELRVFYNTILGELWEVRDRSGVPEKLYDRREHYTAEIPDGVLVVTMGIDTQDNRLEYEVVGWNREEESWGIEYGVIPGRADAKGVWEEVDALLDREWKLANGMAVRIMATFIDSGGHFTDAVYRECAKRANRRIWPIKGESGDNVFVRVMKKGKAGGMAFMINTNTGKEAIMHATTIEKPGARYMHFPRDYRRGYDMHYFRGLISEKLVFHRRGGNSVIAWEKTYERNEPLDCRDYALGAYRYFKWEFDKCERMLYGAGEIQPITREQAERKKRKVMISAGIKV